MKDAHFREVSGIIAKHHFFTYIGCQCWIVIPHSLKDFMKPASPSGMKISYRTLVSADTEVVTLLVPGACRKD
jgi:hypothetical protein